MKIYTKTGDKGLTSLIGGTRVPKSSLRIECYGTVDELNSYIGLVRDQDVNAPRRPLLKEIQDRLFTIGSALAADPEKSKMKLPDLHAADVTLLEDEMDRLNAELARAARLYSAGRAPGREPRARGPLRVPPRRAPGHSPGRRLVLWPSWWWCI